MSKKARQEAIECSKAREIIKELGIEDQELYEAFEFRTIRPEETDEAAEIEQICFPPNEACSREHMKERVAAASDLFLVAIDRKTGKMAGFLNGIATDECDFRDDFFTDAGTHLPDGKNIMLLGLDVLPQYRRRGLGRELVYNYCRKEQARGRNRLILTCLANKVKMYSKFGFRDLGESASEWGGEKWHEMEMILNF
ncbi:MAG: GNAT family N-acetyltransferase [Lachnospiraceae bacterium]|nr:GNAT family N-acetyltransferase [Lachnospiraceae bacterium]